MCSQKFIRQLWERTRKLISDKSPLQLGVRNFYWEGCGNSHPPQFFQIFGDFPAKFFPHLGISTSRKFIFSKFLITFFTIFCIFSTSYGFKIEKIFWPDGRQHIYTHIRNDIKFKQPVAGEKILGLFFPVPEISIFCEFILPEFSIFCEFPSTQNFQKFGNSHFGKIPKLSPDYFYTIGKMVGKYSTSLSN